MNQASLNCIKLNNDIENWEEVGNLDFGGTGSEYMIECPNLVFVDDKPVLLYCPQGLDKTELDYSNIFPNTYKICQSFDTKHAKLVDASETLIMDLKPMPLKDLMLLMDVL